MALSLAREHVVLDSHRYVINNPANFIDPYGYFPCPGCKALVRETRKLAENTFETLSGYACTGVFGTPAALGCQLVTNYDAVSTGVQVADLLPYGAVPGLNIFATPASVTLDGLAAGFAEVDILRSSCSVKKKFGLTIINALNGTFGVGGQLLSDLATVGGGHCWRVYSSRTRNFGGRDYPVCVVRQSDPRMRLRVGP